VPTKFQNGTTDFLCDIYHSSSYEILRETKKVLVQQQQAQKMDAKK
jgi:hypothetical protein